MLITMLISTLMFGLTMFM
ncbi:hypothetical protein [Domibacillus sp. A3M-37]|nr:hypothetical protein [Domibacillus sp. A3M-37]